MGDLILFIPIVSQLFSKKLDQPNIIYCIVSPTLQAQWWQALDLAYCALFMVVLHIKICSFKLWSQPQEANSKTRRSCSCITRQSATRYNALFEYLSIFWEKENPLWGKMARKRNWKWGLKQKYEAYNFIKPH